MLLARPEVFKVWYLSQSEVLFERFKIYSNWHHVIISFIRPVLDGLAITWGILLTPTATLDSFNLLVDLVKKELGQKNLQFMVILDDINRLFSNGRNKVAVLLMLSNCYFKMIMCSFASDHSHVQELKTGCKAFLRCGYTKEEVLMYLTESYPPLECTRHMVFDEERIKPKFRHS